MYMLTVWSKDLKYKKGGLGDFMLEVEGQRGEVSILKEEITNRLIMP